MPMVRLGDLLRPLAPQVLGAVVRRYGHFDLAEDAVQEAMIAAATQWPDGGLPDNPKAWLVTVASRRLTDLLRSEQARQRRENAVAQWVLPEQRVAPPADRPASESDDTLILLFMCCHPALSPASQIALTLRAVGGLSTAEVARALLVPESTMARRITRAKQTITKSGVPFAMPSGSERTDRLAAVLHVLYLIFNEGYTSTSGPTLYRGELAMEAIRLARMLHRLLPDDGEVAGLLALMLLTDARRPARMGADGVLIPMAEQDRSKWRADYIAEGISLISRVLPRGPVGPYQIQAALAAVHDEAPTADKTDWPQILALYEVLMGLSDNPVVALNHAVAAAMVRGPAAGLTLLSRLQHDERIARDHRLPAVRGQLLEMAGDRSAARTAYGDAARLATSPAHQRSLRSRIAHLESGEGHTVDR